MPYMLLIHEPVGQRATRSEDEGRALFERMVQWSQVLKKQGLLLATESLAGQDQGAARIQVRDGRAQTLDGPFAEAKEMVGGFFLLDCASRDQALALARQCPAAEWATVEVRSTGPCFADLL